MLYGLALLNRPIALKSRSSLGTFLGKFGCNLGVTNKRTEKTCSCTQKPRLVRILKERFQLLPLSSQVTNSG